MIFLESKPDRAQAWGAGEGVCFYQERSQTKGKVVITKMPAGFLGPSGHILLVLHIFPKSGVLAGP